MGNERFLVLAIQQSLATHFEHGHTSGSKLILFDLLLIGPDLCNRAKFDPNDH